MSEVVTVGLNLELDVCSAGHVFALTGEFFRQAREKGKSWSCQSRSYRQSEATRLREELEREQQRTVAERARHDQTRAALAHTEKRRQAERSAKTRIKNRIANGVCPCCNRSFANLRGHMKTKHPGYASEES